jgi:hypothetical protein
LFDFFIGHLEVSLTCVQLKVLERYRGPALLDGAVLHFVGVACERALLSGCRCVEPVPGFIALTKDFFELFAHRQSGCAQVGSELKSNVGDSGDSQSLSIGLVYIDKTATSVHGHRCAVKGDLVSQGAHHPAPSAFHEMHCSGCGYHEMMSPQI